VLGRVLRRRTCLKRGEEVVEVHRTVLGDLMYRNRPFGRGWNRHRCCCWRRRQGTDEDVGGVPHRMGLSVGV
jgi:hypothetical protein